MKLTQKQILLEVLKDNEWKYYYELIRVETPFGYLGTEAGRRLRELYKDGLVEKRDIKKGRVLMTQFRKKERSEIIKELNALLKPKKELSNQLSLIKL